MCTCAYVLMYLQDAEHDEVCNGGVARMAIKTGDIRRWVFMSNWQCLCILLRVTSNVLLCNEHTDSAIIKDCTTECLVLFMIASTPFVRWCSCVHLANFYIKLWYSLYGYSSPAPRGVSIAQSMSSKQLKKECAAILEGLKVRSWDTTADVYPFYYSIS